MEPDIEAIKQAIADGKRVFVNHEGYEILPDEHHGHIIKCHMNGHIIGLEWLDGRGHNLNPDDKIIIQDQ